MANIPDNISMEQALRFAQSPAGQKLLQALQAAGGDSMEKIKTLSQNGDYAQAQNAVSEMLKSPQWQKILKEMGRGNG